MGHPLLLPFLRTLLTACLFLIASSPAWSLWTTTTAVDSSISGWTNQPSGVSAWLTCIRFTDEDRGWLSTADGVLLQTTDGGETWFPRDIPNTGGLWAISFSDAMHGTIVGDGNRIHRTDDGGATWTPRTANVFFQRFEGVDFINADTGWVVGGTIYDGPGDVLKTTDGGATWTTQASIDTARPLAIKFFDAERGWAVGAGGLILRTTNGGAAWTRIDGGTIDWLYDLHVFDATHLIAVGGNSTVLLSSDAGLTWSPAAFVPTNPVHHLESVAFVNRNLGYAVSNWSGILRTTDGGSHWARMPNANKIGLFSVTFAGPHHGWAVGHGGTLLMALPTALPPALLSYRTFRQTDYALKVQILRGSRRATAANVRDETFRRLRWTRTGLELGIPMPDSAQVYGWLRFSRSVARLTQFLPHTGPPRGFDFTNASFAWRFAYVNPSVAQLDNHLAGEQFALKFNVGASDAHVTPTGFGDLLFADPARPGGPLDGRTIRSIMAHVDTALTFHQRFDAAYFGYLDTVVSMLNGSFVGPMISFQGSPLAVPAARTVTSVPFLHPNPSAQPQTVPAAGAWAGDGLPTRTLLRQNFPNPFNPVTEIEFALPAASWTTLKVFNVLGQEVAAIYDNELLEAGEQSAEFDAARFTSGVYFYTLTTRGEADGTLSRETRRMLLVK